MKTILLLSIALSGCALIPTPFDVSLYDRTVNISMTAKEVQLQCGTTDVLTGVKVLNAQSKALMKHTEFASNDLHKPFTILDKNITELNTIYTKGTPSTAYCKLKLTIIYHEIDLLLRGIGEKQ